jgi:hypothetical protein
MSDDVFEEFGGWCGESHGDRSHLRDLVDDVSGQAMEVMGGGHMSHGRAVL